MVKGGMYRACHHNHTRIITQQLFAPPCTLTGRMPGCCLTSHEFTLFDLITHVTHHRSRRRRSPSPNCRRAERQTMCLSHVVSVILSRDPLRRSVSVSVSVERACR